MAADSQRVLLFTWRPADGRVQTLRRALDLDGALAVVASGDPLPDLQRVDAVVLDGGPPQLAEGDVARLRDMVRAGGSLLALGAAPSDRAAPLARLLGAVAVAERPRGEVFATRAAASCALLARLDREFPLVDAFAPLRPLDDESCVVLTVNWALRDEPVALERALGAGRIVVSALGNGAEALGNPSLRTFLRRALRPRGAAPTVRSLGVGIVGYGPYGGMGQVHGRAAQAVEGLRFVAACDSNAERLATAQRDFPGLVPYVSTADLAADDEVEVVVVATPPRSHAALALQLLRAGKHVVCEKPLCLTTAEADELIEAARAAGVTLTAHQNRRWDRDFLAIRHAVDDGLLGELFNVETFVGGFEHPCRFWHSDAEHSGGAIYDWGSHYLDWTLQLLPGSPISVTANAHKRVWRDVTNYDQVRVRLLWQDGREAEFFQSDVAAYRRPKFYLQGTAATLLGTYRPIVTERVEPDSGYLREESHHAEAPAELTLARYQSGYGLAETRLPLVASQPFAFHRNLADHLLLGESLAVTAESVRRVIAILEAASFSAANGACPVQLQEPHEPRRNGAAVAVLSPTVPSPSGRGLG